MDQKFGWFAYGSGGGDKAPDLDQPRPGLEGRLRFFPDCGVEFPLWDDGGPLEGETTEWIQAHWV